MCYSTFFPKTGWPVLFGLARFLFSVVGGASTMKLIWAFAISAHLLESCYVALLCKRHRTGFVVGVRVPCYAVYFLC